MQACGNFQAEQIRVINIADFEKENKMKKPEKLRSVIPMKMAKIGYIVLSSVLCVLGMILIVFPLNTVKALSLWCGITFTAFGCIKMIGFFSKDLYRLAFQFDFEFGILMLILGVFMLLHPERSVRLICTALGILALTDSLFKMRITLEAKRFGIGVWWLILLIAVLSGVLGGILLFSPGAKSRTLAILFGTVLISEGILNLSTALTMVKIVRYQLADEEGEKR